VRAKNTNGARAAGGREAHPRGSRGIVQGGGGGKKIAKKKRGGLRDESTLQTFLSKKTLESARLRKKGGGEDQLRGRDIPSISQKARPRGRAFLSDRTETRIVKNICLTG